MVNLVSATWSRLCVYWWLQSGCEDAMLCDSLGRLSRRRSHADAWRICFDGDAMHAHRPRCCWSSSSPREEVVPTPNGHRPPMATNRWLCAAVVDFARRWASRGILGSARGIFKKVHKRLPAPQIILVLTVDFQIYVGKLPETGCEEEDIKEHFAQVPSLDLVIVHQMCEFRNSILRQNKLFYFILIVKKQMIEIS